MEISDPIAAVLAHKSSEVWSTTPETTVLEAIRLMAERNVGALPVLSGGKLVGIISERDYTRQVVLKGRSSKDTPVGDIMTREPVCIPPDDSIEKGMQLVTGKRVRHLPVVQAENLLGIVSIGDLVNWIIAAQDSMIRQLENYIGDVYPA